MADLIRLAALDGQVFAAGILVALTWLILTVKALDSKVVVLDSKVDAIGYKVDAIGYKVDAIGYKVDDLASDIAFLRGRQAEPPDGVRGRPRTVADR